MADEPNANNKLSQDYFRIVAQYSGDLTTYNFQRKKICELDIDIPTFYKEHGRSLDELQVKGIGEKTKGILELILEKGVTEADKLVKEERIDEIRRSAFRGISSKVPGTGDDASPSWDDAIRRYERD